MPPKFQSSFIPKGPVTATTDISKGLKNNDKSLLAFLAKLIFAISVIAASGAFGYKLYLGYSINKMQSDLEQAKQTLNKASIDELTRLDNRIVATKELLSGHRILSPLFNFLELSIPQAARFNNFEYSVSGSDGDTLALKGEARSFESLAFLADIFNKSQSIRDPIFADLGLNERGDVSFTFKATLDPNLLSYERNIEGVSLPSTSPALEQSTTTSDQGGLPGQSQL